DEPKIALTSTYLFVEVDEYNVYSEFARSFVFRVPLSELPGAAPLTEEYFKTQVFSPGLAPGDPGTMEFAGHLDTSTLRLFSWPDSVGVSGIQISDVANTPYPSASIYSCLRPGGPSTGNWCKRDDDRIVWGWNANGVAGFLWDASQGSGGF